MFIETGNARDAEKMMRKKKLIVMLLIMWAFMFRILIGLHALLEENRAHTADSWGYEALGINLFYKKEFVLAPLEWEFKEPMPKNLKKLRRDYPLIYTKSYVYRTPLYPFFIGFIFKMSGYKPFVILLIQMILSALTCYIIFLCFRHDFRTAVILLIISSVDLKSAIQSAQILTETMFSFALCLTSYCILNLCKEVNHKYVIIMGLSILMEMYLRGEVGLYYFIAVLPSLIYLAILKRKIQVIFGIIIPLLGITPWCIRNERVYGCFDISTCDDFNAALYTWPRFKSYLENVSRYDATLQILEKYKHDTAVFERYKRIKKEKKLWKPILYELVQEGELLKKMKKDAFTYYKNHFFKFIFYVVKHVIWTSMVPGFSDAQKVLKIEKEMKSFNLLFCSVKNNFLKLRFKEGVKETSFLLKRLSLKAKLIFFFALMYSVVLIVGFICGVIKCFRHSFCFFIFAVLSFLVTCVIAGVGGYRRHFAVINPLLIITFGFCILRLTNKDNGLK